VTTVQTVADHNLISDLIDFQMRAWNAGDARGFSEGFAADGCFVNVFGSLSYGREAFEEQHAKIFATFYQGSVIRMPIRRIHFLRSDVALVDIDAELSNYRRLSPALSTPADGIFRTRLQEVLVKDRDKWWVASFHNVDVKSEAVVRPSK
jgi:uncharacterized protein (TIGR02246 family)